MSIYTVQIAASLYEILGLLEAKEVLTYNSEQEAIDILSAAFKKHNYKFTIKKTDGKIEFINEHGGNLATVVRQKSAWKRS